MFSGFKSTCAYDVSSRIGGATFVSMPPPSRDSMAQRPNLIRNAGAIVPSRGASWRNVLSASIPPGGCIHPSRVPLWRNDQHSPTTCINSKFSIYAWHCYDHSHSVYMHWHMHGHDGHVHNINWSKRDTYQTKKIIEDEIWRWCFCCTKQNIEKTWAWRGCPPPPTCEVSCRPPCLAHWSWECKMVCKAQVDMLVRRVSFQHLHTGHVLRYLADAAKDVW